MIKRLIKSVNPEGLLDFINSEPDYDFYITEKNSRLYITDSNSFKTLFKTSRDLFYLEEGGDCIGIILVWKSVGGGVSRNYVKVRAINPHIAEKLLTVLLWNVSSELFVKIRKDNKFLNVFKQKGFKFKGGRGYQVLLHRKYTKLKKERIDKDEN